MQIKTITFQQTFPTGPYMNQKLGVEIEIGEHDFGYKGQPTSPEEAAKLYFQEAKKIVNDAFHAMNPSVDLHDLGLTPHQGQHPIPVIDRGKERVKDIISDCTTVDELMNWIPDAVKYGLMTEHDAKLCELTSK